MPTLKDIAYNCRQATYLIEKKQFGGISLKERLQLKYHLTGCSACRIYQQQSIYISEVVQRNYAQFSFSTSSLTHVFKEDLQAQINRIVRSRN